MLTKTQFFCALFFATAFFLCPGARALELIPVGTYQISDLTTNNNGTSGALNGGGTLTQNNNSSGDKAGGGLLMRAGLEQNVALEFGVLYLPREMTSNFSLSGAASGNGAYTTQWDFNYIQVPVLIRIHLLPMVSLGVGAYYAHAIGQIKETNTAPGGGTITGSSNPNFYSYGDKSVPTDDYGLEAALGAQLPLTSSVKFYADFRYLWGLQNIALPASTALLTSGGLQADTNHWRDIQFLAGLSFAFGNGR